jgi:hypothetical protein
MSGQTADARVNRTEPYWLVGDEDCGVGLHCATCYTGGAPIAWYDGYGLPNPYPLREVPTAHTIGALLALGDEHVRRHR